MKTLDGLVQYAQSHIGSPYWYGAFGQAATPELENKLRAEFPNCWNRAGNVSKDYGSYVYDASGIIKGYIWTTDNGLTYNQSQDLNCFGFYLKAARKGKMNDAPATFPGTAGTLVYKTCNGKVIGINHIGVYADGYVYEAKPGEGVVKTPFNANDWPFWSSCVFIDG